MANTKTTTKVRTTAKSVVKSLSFKDLSFEPIAKPATQSEFAVAVRVLLNNWRQGTLGCKGRSDVSLTNKKPWKQKGTGRARAGSARSPLWRGGGVTFGPQQRTKKLSLPRTRKRRVMQTLFTELVNKKAVLAGDWQLEGDRPKTAQAVAFLKAAGLYDQRVTLLLSKSDALTYASFSNIPTVRVLYFDQPNAFDLANADRWLVLKKDLDQFKQMVSRWS